MVLLVVDWFAVVVGEPASDGCCGGGCNSDSGSGTDVTLWKMFRGWICCWGCNWLKWFGRL